ncbi:MAG: zinc ribbon domain-containing protein [Methanoregula sp.]|uniref:zinc ribbon domain-containing protein n=1 Tax=Methanoregula sp. TaxID=2052170 RepID=UPI003C5C6811
MFCQKCGKENKDGAAFCNACGADLSGAPVIDQTPTSIPKPSPKPKKNGGFPLFIALGTVVIVILLVAVFAVLGGTNTHSTAITPISTETLTSVPTQTVAPIQTPIVTQASSTDSGSVQEGTLVITIPPIGSGEAQVMDSEPVAIDGTNVGTVTSASPLTLRLPVGEHNLAVGSYPTRIIDIDFAKTNNQMMSLTDTGGNPSESAASAASGANVVTNNIQGPRSFTGNTDSVQPFSVNQGGYIFTATYDGTDNFIVWITDTSGNKISLLFNTIGSYSGSKIVNLPTGQYYLDIQATGPYTINMAQS